jgi:hypothetical protein
MKGTEFLEEEKSFPFFLCYLGSWHPCLIQTANLLGTEFNFNVFSDSLIFSFVLSHSLCATSLLPRALAEGFNKPSLFKIRLCLFTTETIMNVFLKFMFFLAFPHSLLSVVTFTPSFMLDTLPKLGWFSILHTKVIYLAFKNLLLPVF